MALSAGLNAEAIREVMHELWIAREVERFRDTGWRRTSASAPRHRPQSIDDLTSATVRTGPHDAASLRVGTVRPEDLFDHESFAGWFK